MNSYVTGGAVRTLREKKGLTQKQLADQIAVSDKTVSKWETGRGLPDITLLEPLAAALGISVAELLSGEHIVNRNRAGNMMRGSFYVCPVCGNVIHATGAGVFSCCGITLPPMEAETAEGEHALNVETVENDLYVTVNHPMEKDHFLSFCALVTMDRVQLVKLYPEQNAQMRFPCVRHGMLYVCCNRHGLFSHRV